MAYPYAFLDQVVLVTLQFPFQPFSLRRNCPLLLLRPPRVRRDTRVIWVGHVPVVNDVDVPLDIFATFCVGERGLEGIFGEWAGGGADGDETVYSSLSC